MNENENISKRYTVSVIERERFVDPRRDNPYKTATVVDFKGNSLGECFREYYKYTSRMRYCSNDISREFADPSLQQEYMKYLKSMEHQKTAFDDYYGSGTVD